MKLKKMRRAMVRNAEAQTEVAIRQAISSERCATAAIREAAAVERMATAAEVQAEATSLACTAAENRHRAELGVVQRREREYYELKAKTDQLEGTLPDDCEEYGIEADERYVALMKQRDQLQEDYDNLHRDVMELRKTNGELGVALVDAKVENQFFREKAGERIVEIVDQMVADDPGAVYVDTDANPEMNVEVEEKPREVVEE